MVSSHRELLKLFEQQDYAVKLLFNFCSKWLGINVVVSIYFILQQLMNVLLRNQVYLNLDNVMLIKHDNYTDLLKFYHLGSTIVFRENSQFSS